MNQDRAAALGRTEAVFREVNERIAEAAARFDADDADFVCECADASCVHRVEATLADYERVRGDGATFLLAEGHENPRIEAVVDADDGVAVVRKTDPAARAVVEALDPRQRPER
jgi:hypothetical protein